MPRVGGLGKSPDYRALVEDAHINGTWVAPVPELVRGEVADFAAAADVTCVRIPAYWIDADGGPRVPADAPPAPGERVVYHLHGGAYVLGSAAPSDMTAKMSRGPLTHVAGLRRTMSLEYRLSSTVPGRPANPFPAALLDGLAGYNHLVNVVGFAPADIVVCGDSAGGNLALALVRYLIEEQPFLVASAQADGKMPLAPPGGILLSSPWADIGTSHDAPPRAYLQRTDYVGNLAGARAKFAHTAFGGRVALDTNRWTSPAARALAGRVGFRGWPRTFLACGGAEYLAPAIRTLKERMAGDMGEGVGAGELCYVEAPDAVHDWMVIEWHEPERSEAFRRVAEWFAAAEP
jgi:acetyl esterase/lipase